MATKGDEGLAIKCVTDEEEAVYYRAAFESGLEGDFSVGVATVEKREVTEGADDAEEEETVAYGEEHRFAFENHTAHFFVAQGVFQGTKYQLLVNEYAQPAFTLTLIGADGAHYTVLARKILPPRQPTFFQKYGMFISMGLMMLMQFMKAKPQLEGEEGAPAAGAAAAPAAHAHNE